MRWNFIILRFVKSVESFLLMCWICAETLQEMRWIFIAFTFSQERWNLSTDVLNLCWNFARKTLKFYGFQLFSKVLKLFNGSAEFALKLCEKYAEKSAEFFQDLYLKCAEIILFYVFSRALNFFYWCAEFVLKLCKKWAEILLFYVFSRALKFSYGWAEFVLKLCRTCAEILLLYVFSRALKFFYWCAEFVLKLCKKCAQIFLFSRFLRNAETSQRICWICAETLWKIRRKNRWIFSRLVLKMRWNFIILRFLKSAEIFLRMCWICVETL